jgi:sodium-dependent dicarboxylate transporter 2/3/5
LGGFLISLAMERSGAHKRLALGMLRAVGGVGGRRLVLGFMLATAVLSMWISNTATTLMILPVALAVLDQSKQREALAVPLLLGVAYAANVGGIGTPVGTPPNVVFMAVYEEKTGVEMLFSDWMRIGVPIVLVMLPILWLWLTRNLKGSEKLELPSMGAWTSGERRVLFVFLLTALAWVTRAAPAGGWSGLIGQEGIGDSTVALAAAVLLFVLPDGKGGRLMDWETTVRVPWGLLVLFGGGLAIAKAFETSGLSASLGQLLSQLANWPALGMMAVICLSVTFLTEITSNTATTSLLMPILAAAGIAAAIDPKLLMVPAAISASCAFMLPVATAPNAIIFGTGEVDTRRMIREGFVLNLAGAAIITLLCVSVLA